MKMTAVTLQTFLDFVSPHDKTTILRALHRFNHVHKNGGGSHYGPR